MPPPPKKRKLKCEGANACKGQSACKHREVSPAVPERLQGRAGFLELTKAEREAAHAKAKSEKPAKS